MTDTETKALAMELRTAITPRGKITRPFFFIVRDAADYIEATEARHAAEMRELKERFSGVLGEIKVRCANRLALDEFNALAAPFIIPAPPCKPVAARSCWGRGIMLEIFAGRRFNIIDITWCGIAVASLADGSWYEYGAYVLIGLGISAWAERSLAKKGPHP